MTLPRKSDDRRTAGMAIKRRQPRRDWTDAREKVEREGCCRACGTGLNLEAAHIIGRARDAGPRVHPDDIVPLCGPATSSGTCHGRYDSHALDLLPFVTNEEAAAAVLKVGLEPARRRMMGAAWREAA